MEVFYQWNLYQRHSLRILVASCYHCVLTYYITLSSVWDSRWKTQKIFLKVSFILYRTVDSRVWICCGNVDLLNWYLDSAGGGLWKEELWDEPWLWKGELWDEPWLWKGELWDEPWSLDQNNRWVTVGNIRAMLKSN